MHSLRTKIILITLGMIMVAIAAIGLISVISIQKTAEQISTQYMNEMCEEKANEMNYFLDEIKQDVDIAAHYMTDEMSAVELVKAGVVGAIGTGDSIPARDPESEQQKEFDAFLRGYTEDAKAIMHSVAYNSGNALTYFYYSNPEFSAAEPGFIFVREGQGDFKEKTNTEGYQYDLYDPAQCSWYFQALDLGRPAWLPPYEDQNLGDNLTTYIAPIYTAGTFCGVVGMDVSYLSLEEKIDNLNVYKTGYAFLTDEFGKIIYHPFLTSGSHLSEVNRELEAQESYVSNNEQSSDLIEYTYGNVRRRAAWRTLHNGLRLFVCAPVAEMEESWQQLILRIVILAGILLVVFSIIMALIIRRFTKPLQKLTLASQEIEKGNYDVELTYSGRDEVGVLTRSFRHLTEHLKVYVSDLNSKAYKDALTNVKNKAALDIYTAQLDKQKPEEREYAVILFDCNNLKEINDVYGHDKGDIYLQTACELICRSFPRSPVFRMGGDEFVAILQKDAYTSRNELLQQFRESAENVNLQASTHWEKANVACGLAEYDVLKDQEFADVLKRADEEMYEDKKEWKKQNPLPG